MKRYLKYIFIALASAILAVSCLEELEPTPSLNGTDQVAVIVPRVKSFTNQYVTKAAYGDAEQAINDLKVLIFDNDGDLVHTQAVDPDSRSFTLNKSMLNSPEHKGKLTAATVVMLANMNTSLGTLKKANGETNITSLDDLKSASFHIAEAKTVLTSVPSEGFPMIGGKVVDLSPTSSTSSQDAVVVDLKILYAKINFEISVEPDGDNERVDPSNTQQMQFQLSGYSIYNVSKVTSLDIPDNAGEPVRDIFGNVPDEDDIADFDESTASSEYAYPATGNGAKMTLSKTATLNGPSIPFTFYMAESRFNRSEDNAHEDLIGIYPEDWLTPAEDEDVKGWTDLSAEQKKLPQNKLNGVKYGYDHLIQQFKPKIVEQASSPSPGAGLATYVLLTGTYKDYRGTNWNVNYKVYLGKDNAQNFHVDRNSEYTNYISIKGIRHRQEGSYGEGDVWIDHRVNVSVGSGQGADNCVTITRETLLDAHIEVRPLRVQWSGTTYDRVNVYLPTKTVGDQTQLIDWIGIEKFTGENCQDGATYCFVTDPSTNESYSIGKRKYFTTGLINELQNMGGELGVKTDKDGRKFLDFYNGHCAWIYFDENTSSTSRDAVIRLEFYKEDRMTAAEEYTIRQNGLQTIEGTNYIVESYEEYLHSYDSEDKYNLSTSPVDYTQQGLAWGFPDKSISKNIIVSATPIQDSSIPVLSALNWVAEGEYFYDYFHSSDVTSGSYYSYIRNGNNWTTTGYGTGLTFTDRAAANQGVTVMDMGTIPSSAYQYCLSKNKFKESVDGYHKLDIHWYLPDVYELQAVLQKSQNGTSYADFATEASYWSSQPAISGFTIPNVPIVGEVGIRDENETYARAVSVSKSQGKVEPVHFGRNEQHRIRCFYSSTGIKDVDMSQRVPDGLGGNYTFLMQGKPDNGYFHNLVAAAGTEDTSETVIQDFDHDEWYEYPREGNSDATTEFKYTSVVDVNNITRSGFEVNPTLVENWNEVAIDIPIYGKYQTGYYYTLGTYDGLIANELRKISNIEIDLGFLGSINLGDYIDLGIEAYAPIENTAKSQTKIMESSSIKDMTQIPLPETLKPLNDKLTLSLSANGNTKRPDFEYYEVVSKNTTTYTREWVPPVYNKKDYELAAKDTTLTDSGEATNSASISALLGGSKNRARQSAFNDAYSAAKQNALAKLRDKFNTIKSKGWTFNEADVKYTSLTWESPEPAVKYVDSSSGSIIKTYKATCTVKLTATATLSKPGSATRYIQASGTGDWGEPDNGVTERVAQSVETDELRVYSGNSITINCADPAYEITKIRVYFSGSNKIGNETYSPLYYARFVDVDIPADDPIPGDETSHLFGMEYSDADGWQQWSGAGSQSVTLTLADFVLTSNADWWDIISGNWATYDYEYRKASRNLNYYLVVDRIEVKCTEIKKPEEESTE